MHHPTLSSTPSTAADGARRRRPRALRSLALAGAALALAGALAACGSSDSGSSTTTTAAKGGGNAAGIAKLKGTSWDLVSFRATDGKTTDADTSSVATLAFQAKKLTGSTGCNNFSGTYTATATDLKIELGPMTQKACAGGLPSEQESTLVASLAKVDAYTISSDQLVLSGGGKELLTYQAGRDGVVGDWVITGVNNGKGAVVGTSDTEKLTASFAEEMTFSGFGGCNQLSGDYSTSGTDGIKIGPLAGTMKACEGTVGETEAQYTAALQAATTWEVSGNTLTLRDDSGAMQVTATAKS
ncbi:MAG: META domain-containing protein [Acidimicrobiales bacterium]